MVSPPPSPSPLPAAADQMRAAPAGGRRRKVALAPGHSHLDWMRLTATLPRYRGPTMHTAAEMAAHRRRGDAWTVIRGRVYDVSRYVDFHPGGAAMLLSGAGKDATALFDKYHPWVNIDAMMRGLCIGELVDDTDNADAASGREKKAQPRPQPPVP